MGHLWPPWHHRHPQHEHPAHWHHRPLGVFRHLLHPRLLLPQDVLVVLCHLPLPCQPFPHCWMRLLDRLSCLPHHGHRQRLGHSLLRRPHVLLRSLHRLGSHHSPHAPRPLPLQQRPRSDVELPLLLRHRHDHLWLHRLHHLRRREVDLLRLLYPCLHPRPVLHLHPPRPDRRHTFFD